MNYQALLFCPEEKTARVLTQVLIDLEFRVEPISEPFAAVKMLMGQRFDAVVVDCENEQNATLLFKSARNSSLNQSALSVAVVEGQAGVAKAFRLGANLVLTKPINVEQSKGTLRVARGLLRKADAAKPAAADAAPSVQAPPQMSPPRPSAPVAAAPRITPAAAVTPPPIPTRTPVPIRSVERQIPAAASSAFELSPETRPELDPVEAALLESMPETKLRTESVNGSSPSTKDYAWQTASKTGARTSSQAMPSAAAAAPAKEATVPANSNMAVMPEPQPAAVEIPQDTAIGKSGAAALSQEPALFSTVGLGQEAGTGSSSGKIVLIAAIVLVAAGGIYFGWTKMRSGGAATATAPAAQPTQPATAASNATQPQAAPTPVTASPLPIANSAMTGSPAPATKLDAAKNSAPAAEAKTQKTTASKLSEAEIATDAAAPVMVQGGRIPAPPSVANTADPEAPAVDVASNAAASALSGIVGTSGGSIPKRSGQGLQVSQGVSQGLLIHKVSPVYPRQAQQAHVQGAVQLMATIAEDGSISAVEVLKGDPLLAGAASDAVKQWKYKPYYLDGQPVSIQTQITLNFKLP